jgi:hypothetical protein
MEHFNTEAPAADLIQNDFDNFKDWRVAKVIEKERAAALNKGEEYEPDAQTGLQLKMASSSSKLHATRNHT